jgi:MFS family permease
VYLLYIVPLMGPGGGSFGVLMKTEQLGFSKAELGFSVSVGMVVMVVVFAPLAGYLTDKTSRMRLLRIGIIGPAAVELIYFLYLRYVADYSIPLSTAILFGLAGMAFKTCAYLVWGALVFDYIPRNQFGTVSAGLTVFGGLTPFLMINLAGFWITQFTKLFGTAGGSRYDYSSLYVLQVGCAAAALWITYFFEREERKGNVLPLGRNEVAQG